MRTKAPVGGKLVNYHGYLGSLVMDRCLGTNRVFCVILRFQLLDVRCIAAGIARAPRRRLGMDRGCQLSERCSVF